MIDSAVSQAWSGVWTTRAPTMCRMDGALREEATKLLADLIRIDTSNPPGHETPAAVFLQWFLEREGIACELIAKDPDRANLVARIKGSGEGPSLTLLGHTDVVPAERESWSVDPFEGVVRDGYVWGRGALDMKSHTVCNVLAFALIARSGIRPRGDLVLIAEADEEEGTTGVGLPFVVAQRPDVRTDYALNESSERMLLADGRVVHLFCTGEKATMPVRVTARGRPGHASWPDSGDNALVKLGPAIERFARHRPSGEPAPELMVLLDALVPGDDTVDERIARSAELHPELPATLGPLRGSTVSPTMIVASNALNVIPGHAELRLDCRVLPGTEPDDLMRELRACLGDIDVQLALDAPPDGGSRSPADTPLAGMLRDYVETVDPGALVLPSMSGGFTNSHYLREAFGTIAYGFFPLLHTPLDLIAETVHAHDERIDQDDLTIGVRFLEHACRTIGGFR
jgi:acetylornithine deacetylase/succinyl-diaminopimelate desuccinylase-like protein